MPPSSTSIPVLCLPGAESRPGHPDDAGEGDAEMSCTILNRAESDARSFFEGIFLDQVLKAVA